jgi:hypothetical protein
MRKDPNLMNKNRLAVYSGDSNLLNENIINAVKKSTDIAMKANVVISVATYGRRRKQTLSDRCVLAPLFSASYEFWFVRKKEIFVHQKDGPTKTDFIDDNIRLFGLILELMMMILVNVIIVLSFSV